MIIKTLIGDVSTPAGRATLQFAEDQHVLFQGSKLSHTNVKPKLKTCSITTVNHSVISTALNVKRSDAVLAVGKARYRSLVGEQIQAEQAEKPFYHFQGININSLTSWLDSQEKQELAIFITGPTVDEEPNIEIEIYSLLEALLELP